MTWICYRGIELSARTQQFLLGAEIAILAALRDRRARQDLLEQPAPARCTSRSRGSTRSTCRSSALVDGVLLGIFIYWGWDSGVSVNEESEDSAEGPGKAAVVSTVLLLLIYVDRLRRRAGLRRHRRPRSELERRAERARPRRLRLALEQAADHRRAHLGRRLDADDDPARPRGRRSRWRAGARSRRCSARSTRAT